MESLFLFFMQAEQAASETAPASGQGGGGGSPLSLLFPFILIFGIMYIFLIMPQKRREKRHRALVAELKKNDRVVTAGGMHGIVTSVKEGIIVLKVDDDKDVKVTVNQASIAQVVPREEKDSQDNK